MRKYLKTIALVLFTAGVLWRLWRGLNWTEVSHAFSQADTLLLGIALALSAITNLIRSFRWQALLAPLAPANLRSVFAATNVGIGANFLLGAAFAEVVRPLSLSLLNKRVRPATSFLTIVAERVFDLSVVALLSGCSLLWLPALTNTRVDGLHLQTIAVILLVSPLIGFGVIFWLKRHLYIRTGLVRAKLSQWRSAPHRVQRATARVLTQLIGALSLLTDARQLVVVSLWTIVQWASVVLTTWLTLRAFGLGFGIKETVVVMCCGLFGSLVPTPGGAAGAFHAALSGGLLLLGVPLEKAAAISIAAHLVGFVPSVVFGSYYLMRGSLHVDEIQREMAVNSGTFDTVGSLDLTSPVVEKIS